AAIEVFGGFGVALERLGARFGDADELQESGAVRIPILPEAVHFLPETLHHPEAGFVPVVGQVAIDVVHLRTPTPRLDRAATRNPDRRMRIVLDRTWPDIDVALLVEAAVEGECFLLLPSLHDEVMGFEIALAQHG